MRSSNNKGFTLLETLIALAILIIGGAIAIPSMMDMAKKSGVKAEARAVKDNLLKARMEAVRRNGWVTTEYRQASNDYVIFVDSTPPDYTYDGDEVVINTVPLTEVSFDTTQGDGDGIDIGLAHSNVISWDPRGMSFSTGGGLSNGSIYLKKNDNVYKLLISQAGNVRIVNRYN